MPDQLYAESLESLRSIDLSKTIVDVGAGSGILGIPALLEGMCEKLVLIEPQPKKAAFLEYFRSQLHQYDFPLASKVKVLPLFLENVSRETLESFAQGTLDNVDFVVRAFSGAKTLKEAFDQSGLPTNRVYDFFVDEKSTPQKFMLRKVSF